MDNVIRKKDVIRGYIQTNEFNETVKNISQATVNSDYVIKEIETDDEELKNFLFTLGCYKGESISLISILSQNYVVRVKDAKYSIDIELAEAIQV